MISANSLGADTKGADVIQGTADKNNMISHAYCIQHESI